MPPEGADTFAWAVVMLSETQICETSGQSSNLNNGKGNKYCDIPVHCRVGFCQKTFLVQTNHKKSYPIKFSKKHQPLKEVIIIIIINYQQSPNAFKN